MSINPILDERCLLVLYATETGTAQDAGERVAREARRLHFRVRVVSVDAYPLAKLVEEPRVVFVVATTGSGIEPRMMTPMWNALLRPDLPADLFEATDYAVFGLGDSSYPRFNWAAKKLARRLEGLGAVEMCPRGEGDEQNPSGIEGALDAWLPGLLQSLCDMEPLPEGFEPLPKGSLPPPRASLVSPSDQGDTTAVPESWERDILYHQVHVTCNDRLTAPEWYQDVRHIELEAFDDIDYAPSDVAIIAPETSAEDVDTFLGIMQWEQEADQLFTILPTHEDQPLPSGIRPEQTLRSLFTKYLDICAIPRRSFFETVRHFANSDLEKERLEEFCTPEGYEDLYDYCYQVRRTIMEVLSEFRSVRIPKEYIFDVFPPLRPRHFSIASSVKAHPRKVQLCIAIVTYKTKLQRPRKGVATSYISRLKPGEKLVIGIQKGLMRLPAADIPIVCVGPGTGIAPMRAILEERTCRAEKDNTLYFGCRSASKDAHYMGEWKKMDQDGGLKLRCSYSRDGPEGVARTYVQHLMEQDTSDLWALIGERRAWVYISGSSNKMPEAVKRALADAARFSGAMSDEEAAAYPDLMEKEGRLFEECWS